MTRQAYNNARTLIRQNGYYAVRWLRMSEASTMLVLKNQRDDFLALKAEADRIQNWKKSCGLVNPFGL